MPGYIVGKHALKMWVFVNDVILIRQTRKHININARNLRKAFFGRLGPKNRKLVEE